MVIAEDECLVGEWIAEVVGDMEVDGRVVVPHRCNVSVCLRFIYAVQILVPITDEDTEMGRRRYAPHLLHHMCSCLEWMRNGRFFFTNCNRKLIK